MLLDLHCHSKYSKDAATSPKHIARIAKQKGLIVALTDHDNANGWKEYSNECKQLGIEYILGQEQKVFWNKQLAGELLFYFLNEEIKANSVFEAIDIAKTQDAMVSVAHPFDNFRKWPRGNFVGIEKLLGKIDAVEVFNARCISKRPNRSAMDFAKKNSLGKTAGSDAHFPDEIGHGYLETEATTLEEARKKIISGNVAVFGKKSPFNVHIRTQLVKRGIIQKETD